MHTQALIDPSCSSLPFPWRWRYAMLAFSGLLTGLTVVFPLIGMLEWVSLVPCMAVLLCAFDRLPRLRARQAYLLGLCFFSCFYLVNFHWFLAMYPLEFTGISPAAALSVVLFAWIGLSLFQAVGAALIFPIFITWLKKAGVLQRHRALQIPVLACLWVILEWAQTLFWTGVPWARLPLGQVQAPVMLNTAAWLGSYGITFSLVLFNAALAYAVLYPHRLRLCAVVCAASLLFTAGGGVVAVLAAPVDEAEQTVRVAAIQGNLGSSDKWDLDTSKMYLHYYEMTEQAAATGAELIIWPETAVPITLFRSPVYAQPLSELAREYGATLLVGTFTEDEEGGKYNSMVVVRPDGSVGDTVYSKRHLVPFGEYVPMEELIRTLFPPLAELMQTHILPGEDAAIFDERVGRIGALICFDSIYEQLTLESVRSGAQLLTVSTNDSWFFDSAASRMHHAQAQLRAIESGRWVVRAASTGISSLITPTGQVVASAPALTEDIVYGTVALQEHTTLYTRIGNVVVWLSLAAVAAIGISGLACRKKEEPLP